MPAFYIYNLKAFHFNNLAIKLMYNIDKTVWRQLGWVIVSANTSIFQWHMR